MEHKIASAKYLPLGKMMSFTNDGKENLGGRYYAIGNKCIHRGCKLSNSILSGSNAICPNARAVVQHQKLDHGSAIHLSKVVIKQPTFKIGVKENQIVVKNGGARYERFKKSIYRVSNKSNFIMQIPV